MIGFNKKILWKVLIIMCDVGCKFSSGFKSMFDDNLF